MLQEMFKKTLKVKNNEKLIHTMQRPQVPEGLFQKCPECGQILCTEDIISNYHTCPACNFYFRINARTRIAMVADPGSFQEWNADLPVNDPLSFPGYRKKLENFKNSTQLDESVITGQCTIRGLTSGIAVMDASFMMGSMGSVTGEKITRMIEKSTLEKLPVIIFSCSGGARMQEGIFSLMQMAKTSQALKRHSDEGNLFISVLTDPTTGGVTASFALLGDVILAEPGALIGFAGPRVIEQTIKQKLPKGFQSSEFLLEKGFVDRIVKRNQLRKTLAFIIRSAQC